MALGINGNPHQAVYEIANGLTDWPSLGGPTHACPPLLPTGSEESYSLDRVEWWVFQGPALMFAVKSADVHFRSDRGGGVGEALKARNRVAHLAGDPTELSDHHEHGRQSPEGGGVSEPKRSIPVAVAGQVISSLLTMPLLDVRNERATCQHAARASLQAANSQRW